MPPAGQLEWLHWAKHKDLYGELRYLLIKDALTILQKLGPISCLQIMGQHIIIINDFQTALELLERKSSVSSDRPASVFGGIMWDNVHSVNSAETEAK